MTFKSFGLGNPPFHPIFVNLGSDFDFTTPIKPNINPTHEAPSTCLTHAIATTPKSTRVKRKKFIKLHTYD